jgi:hypothetical protein
VTSAAAAGSSSGRPSFGRAAVRTTSGSMIFLTVRVSGPPSPRQSGFQVVDGEDFTTLVPTGGRWSARG